MFVKYNPNPKGSNIGDCVIRALTKAMGQDWDSIYLDLAMTGYTMKDMPSSNRVWGTYLLDNGFKRVLLPDTCPSCYTIRDFCNDFTIGTYILATGAHVVAVIDGDYYDSWDSGNEVPAYLFMKEENL